MALSMQPSRDGNFFYYVKNDGPPTVFRETLHEDHLDQPEEVEGIPRLVDAFSMFVARKGIYFVSAAKPTVLQYFDFPTHRTKELVKMDKQIVGGVWVSGDERFALLPQLSDSHQDIMLAEPKR